MSKAQVILDTRGCSVLELGSPKSLSFEPFQRVGLDYKQANRRLYIYKSTEGQPYNRSLTLNQRRVPPHGKKDYWGARFRVHVTYILKDYGLPLFTKSVPLERGNGYVKLAIIPHPSIASDYVLDEKRQSFVHVSGIDPIRTAPEKELFRRIAALNDLPLGRWMREVCIKDIEDNYPDIYHAWRLDYEKARK